MLPFVGLGRVSISVREPRLKLTQRYSAGGIEITGDNGKRDTEIKYRYPGRRTAMVELHAYHINCKSRADTARVLSFDA